MLECQSFSELVKWTLLVLSLRHLELLIEVSGVLVAAVQMNVFAEQFYFFAYLEVPNGQEAARIVAFKYLHAFQELSLGNARVRLFVLIRRNCWVLQIKHYGYLSDSEQFFLAFHRALLEVALESDYVAFHFHPVRDKFFRGLIFMLVGLYCRRLHCQCSGFVWFIWLRVAW